MPRDFGSLPIVAPSAARLPGPGNGSLAVLALCVSALISCGTAGEPAAASEAGIQGLWEVTSIRNLTKGEDQPHRREYHQFGDTHQMVILAGRDRPKLSKSLSDMTPDEFQSQQPLGAGLYRYEWDGENKVVRTNIVALSAYYEGRSFPGELVLSGDTLVLRDSHSADGDEREWTMRRVK
ncbi:MAG: hypothetical protein OXN96_11415 [Bryobacterales bacterium]|nr:hypothetical protein [Bryobacterales bacterium]